MQGEYLLPHKKFGQWSPVLIYLEDVSIGNAILARYPQLNGSNYPEQKNNAHNNVQTLPGEKTHENHHDEQKIFLASISSRLLIV